VYVYDRLDGRAATYGWLMTAPGVGAFSAGVWLAWRGLKGALLRIACAPIVAGLCLCGFALRPGLALSLILLFGAGFSFLTLLNSCNTLLQTYADDDKRGRVLSFYSMSFLGMAPIGSLLIGATAHWMGVVGAMVLAGSMCMMAGVYFQVVRKQWQEEVRATIRAKRAPPAASSAPEDLGPPAAAEVPPPIGPAIEIMRAK
jgi:MFS family permease